MGSRFEKFTERSRRCLSKAQDTAVDENHTFIGPEHILYAMTREEECVGTRTLRAMGMDTSALGAEVLSKVQPGAEGKNAREVGMSPEAKTMIERAVDHAVAMGNTFIGTEHLLLGILEEQESHAGRILREAGADIENTKEGISKLIKLTRPPQ